MFYMLFFKRTKNVENSEIVALKTRITKLEAEILDLATSINVIRNKVLRKIQFKQEETAQEEQDLNTKEASTGLLSDDFMGTRGKH